MTPEQAAELLLLTERSTLANEQIVEWIWRMAYISETTMFAACLACGALWAIIFIRALYAKNIWT